jgi:hypothetical protein
MTRFIPLPDLVVELYAWVEKAERLYPGRPFTPDGHLIGSIGEVIAQEAFGLDLHKPSRKGHDAVDQHGRQVQVKITGGTEFAFRRPCDHLIALQIQPCRTKARVVYEGPGEPVRERLGRQNEANGQRTISVAKLLALSEGGGV